MYKKIGIWFISVFTILLVLLIVFNEQFPILLFVICICLVTSLIPMGAAFVVIESSLQKIKRVKRTYLIISVSLIILGFMFKFLRWPGANVMLVVGVLWYCFAYSPLQLRDKYLQWLPFTKSKFENILLSTIDYVGLSTLLIGGLSKLLHWPLANIEMMLGSLITLIGLIAWNVKFKKEIKLRKQAEDTIKEQYKEITDSIEYALRIQSAILPPQKIVKQYLDKSFILYKPKDIVAGDFYWMETVRLEKENQFEKERPNANGHHQTILFAACDCTGHGVPGAMVSVVCHNALNRAVREFGLTQPAAILNKTRELVIENFSKSEEDIKDGMDISLASIRYDKQNTKIELEWAGANNPLWIVRNTSATNTQPLLQLEEIKADKQPIGVHEESKPFTNHQLTLTIGDTIYLFTDGFADQFGGDTGDKKLTRKRFKEVLLSIQDKPMHEQGALLDGFIVEYRKEIEQIDDILVMGVKV